MSQPPTKREVLERYRNVISDEDFEFLISEELPSPESSRQDGTTYQVLGSLNGCWVLAKKYGYKVIGVLILMGGGVIPGLEYVNKYLRIAYEQVPKVVSMGQEHCDLPATEYRIAEKPKEWAIPTGDSIYLVDSSTATTTTTTTTTTPAPEQPIILPSGTGLIPYSSDWGGIA